MLIFDVIEEIGNWFKAFLITVGEYIHSATVTVLVFAELLSETKFFARVRTVAIFLTSFALFTSIAILIGRPPMEKPDMGLSMYQFCSKYGYTVYNETTLTEDGYILKMHRIYCPQNQTYCKTRGPPVLIVHGFLGSSADFVAAKHQSLAFQLADKGYDVWLGNFRGNIYSREHVMLDPDEDPHFWDFSFHEMGFYDLPAMIDHVISKTHFHKVTFIGSSQGCAAYMALCSLKPEYNKKIILANLLAPITTFYGTKSLLLALWARMNFIIERVVSLRGPFEIFGDSKLETTLLRYSCLGPHKIANYFCTEQILTHIMGLSDQKNYEMMPFHLSVSPAGVSIKALQHIVQNRISGKFAQYDYYQENLEIYNQDTAPIYNISKITAPIAAYFGKADLYVSVEGLHQQLRLLPNVVLRYKVPYDRFNHLDFIYSVNLDILLNNKLINIIDSYNKKIIQ